MGVEMEERLSLRGMGMHKDSCDCPMRQIMGHYTGKTVTSRATFVSQTCYFMI